MYYKEATIVIDEFDGVDLKVFQEYRVMMEEPPEPMGSGNVSLYIDGGKYTSGYENVLRGLEHCYLIYLMMNGTQMPIPAKAFLDKHIKDVLDSSEINYLKNKACIK
tara:strand:- start:1641 stop:1961 length:321 start_codon:yes stop_codon:yes gene_type:complete